MHIPPCTFNSKLFIIQCKLYASICHTGEVGLGNGDKCLSVFIRDTFSHAFSVHWWLKEGWRKGVDCAHNSLEQDNELGRPRWPPALRMQCRGFRKETAAKADPLFLLRTQLQAAPCSLLTACDHITLEGVFESCHLGEAVLRGDIGVPFLPPFREKVCGILYEWKWKLISFICFHKEHC